MVINLLHLKHCYITHFFLIQRLPRNPCLSNWELLCFLAEMPVDYIDPQFYPINTTYKIKDQEGFLLSFEIKSQNNPEG